MANTPEAIWQQNAAIKQALDETYTLAKQYSKVSLSHAGAADTPEPGEVGEAHTALSLQAAKLLRTVRGPVDMVFSHFENSATTGAARALLEMGVFEALPLDGSSRTAAELSESLGVDRVLLVRLMRMATITELFQEVGLEEYAHTRYSRVYLVPELRGVFKLMVDEYLPAKTRLYEFFRVNGWENPISERNNPYTFAHQTNNQTMWEFLGERPDRAKVFNYAMAAQSKATNWTVGIFPFERELSKYETDENAPLVVDVGGGKGHATRQIRELCPNIKGRMILQDRPEVIADITEALPGVERMGHDFFTAQPVKGALLYYIRRCLHDWSDELCIKILKLLAEAMTPGKSRLLIAEIVLPAVGADLEAGWMDLTMMTLTGTERTERQWDFLLEASGFKLDKVHTAPGTNYGVVEASLK